MRFYIPTITHAAADVTRGKTDTPVAEVVTFRLNDGTDPTEFATAANAMTPLLKATGAALTRTLSADETGLWTDHITWTSMHAAKKAASSIMEEPAAAPFMQMIDPETVEMRHAPIKFTMPLE